MPPTSARLPTSPALTSHLRQFGDEWALCAAFTAGVFDCAIAIRPEITKNKLPGTIVLSHPTWSRLKEYVEGERAASIRCHGADWNGPIFLSDSQRNPGQPISKWTVKDIFDRLRNALHLPQLTPHKMRHLMLTELKRSGMERHGGEPLRSPPKTLQYRDLLAHGPFGSRAPGQQGPSSSRNLGRPAGAL